MLSDEVRLSLGLPDYYYDEYNATPMLNYWPIIEPIINLVRPDSICEIGSERGLTSSHILKNIDSVNRVDIVDPLISPMLKKAFSGDSRVTFHEKKSLEYFQNGGNASFYFLDGDHNYQTLLSELKAIEANRLSNSPLFILLHDVAWSWGRRNMYYSPEDINDDFVKVTDTSLSLETSELGGQGFPTGDTYYVADKYGGPENGLLTAVEDFVDQSALKWKYAQIPSLWGLGFLWLDSSISKEISFKLDNHFQHIKTVTPFLSILEANRLRLLQGLNEWMYLANNRGGDVEFLEKEREELFNVAEERLAEVNRLGKEREELFNVAEERLVEINRLGKEREELFNVAEGRLSELQKFDRVREEFERNVERLSISNEALESKLNTFEKSGFYKIFRFFNRT